MAREKQPSVPAALRPTYEALVAITDAVCRAHLNDEYADLAREMTAALCRKRPSPVLRGQPKTWACGIVYAIGAKNFLFDRSQNPYIAAGDLCKLFGVGASTGSAKAAEIRKLLKIRPFDHAWTLPSRVEDNPLIWMLSVNGFLMDIRDAPRGAQEEALRRGLIPYIPADRPDHDG